MPGMVLVQQHGHFMMADGQAWLLCQLAKLGGSTGCLLAGPGYVASIWVKECSQEMEQSLFRHTNGPGSAHYTVCFTLEVSGSYANHTTL